MTIVAGVFIILCLLSWLFRVRGIGSKTVEDNQHTREFKSRVRDVP